MAPAQNPLRLLDRYGVAGRRVIMTLGRLDAAERYKGIDEVLEVMPSLVHEMPDLVYLILGDADDRPRLESKAKALGLDQHVIFAGYIPEAEKADHYRLADAFVMPGRGVGFGLRAAIKEALIRLRGSQKELEYFSFERFVARWHALLSEEFESKIPLLRERSARSAG